MSSPTVTPGLAGTTIPTRRQLYAVVIVSALAVSPFVIWPELTRRLLATHFLPHLYCYLRNPGLVWTHVVADTLIGIAYLTISVTLAMHSRSHPVSYLTLALAVATVLISACRAQEAASVDLTKVAARVDLRRPEETLPPTGGFSGTQQTHSCPDSSCSAGALLTSLVSLDRTHFQVGEKARFEVTVENVGSTPITIPFSPHLADLQPKNSAQKFAYSEVQITLWIAASEDWSTNTGGWVILYGANDHGHTMMTLNPGEWVRVIGEGHLALDLDLVKLTMSGHPADHMYAQASIFREETLITAMQSATLSREVCLVHTQGESIPTQLTIP